MVAVVHAAPQAAAPQAVSAWLASLVPDYSEDERASLADALEYARARTGDAAMADGESALDRALGTATILAGLRLDADSLRAAVLLGVPVAGAFDADAIRERFGADVATLVAGVTRMGGIRAVPEGATKEERATQAENLRKMLLAMVEDIRVVLIKLAERTQALRSLMSGDAQWRARTAHEVLDLFAPLANRLGVWQLKWELEDLSLRRARARDVQVDREAPGRAPPRPRALHHRRRRHAEERARGVGRRRGSDGPAEAYLQHLEEDAAQAGEHRHALRHSRGACPRRFGQGLLHGARPRASPMDAARARVRRLHRQAQGQQLPLAAHRGDRSRGQAARSADPHARDAPAFSEYGVASHWRYKEGSAKGVRHDPTFDEKIAWLRQVLDWKDTVADSSEWLAAFKESLFTDAIYVLTPQGKVIDLPRGCDAGRLRLRRAHGPRPPLPRRQGRRPDGAAQLPARERAAGRDRRGEAGRPVARLAQRRSWATCTATARAPRCGSGSRRSSTRRPSRRDARSSSASSRASAARALKLDAVAAKAGFDKTDEFFAAFARDDINSKQVQTAILAVAQPGAAAPAPAEPEVATRRSQRRGLGQRHSRGRRRSPADRTRALLQASAARSDRRLRHARQGRDDPSRGVQQRRTACEARSPSA